MENRDEIRQLIIQGHALTLTLDELDSFLQRIEAAGFAYWETLALSQHVTNQVRQSDRAYSEKVNRLIQEA